MEWLIWLQDLTFSTWLRESDWALFALLIVHTMGMAFLAGTAIVVALRALGVAAQIPLPLMSRFKPVMMSGLMAVILSGLLLVASYPAKALTNPLFYLKLLVVTAAVLTTRAVLTKVTTGSGDAIPLSISNSILSKRLAMLSIILWVIAITAGKFLAYTNTMLLVY